MTQLHGFSAPSWRSCRPNLGPLTGSPLGTVIMSILPATGHHDTPGIVSQVGQQAHNPSDLRPPVGNAKRPFAGTSDGLRLRHPMSPPQGADHSPRLAK